MEELRYQCLACDPPSSAVIGTKEELETHLAEYHHTFYPHHCRTCGYRTYDKRAIYERCVPLKHKVVFWEVREEEEEGQLAIELRACLRNPKPMVSLSTDASSTQLADTFAPLLVEASPLLPDGAEPQLEDGMEIEVVKTASVRAETTAVPATERVPPTAQGKPSFKRASKPQVHTTMTCQFTGCGKELVVRGKTDIKNPQKSHVQERHLPDIAIRCPVRGCQQKCRHAAHLAFHLGQSHGGVKELGAGEIASYRAVQKRVLDASNELLLICFPAGAVSRDGSALAKKKSQCAKCEKKVVAYLAKLRMAQKAHIESDHLAADYEIRCPVGRCGTRFASLPHLSEHIRRCHGVVASLSEEESNTYSALRERINAAGNKLLVECFPNGEE